MPSFTVYTTALRPLWQADARQGGPQGEIRVLDDLVEGLRALGAGVTLVPSLRWFYARRKLARLLGSGGAGRRMILDPWTLGLALQHRLIDDRDAKGLRILEWYGTPRAQVPPLNGLGADQYLLPYPDPRHGNHWIGFLIRDEQSRPLQSRDDLARYVRESMTVKKPQGVVWGKEARYFTGEVQRMLQAIGAHCELHLTLSPARGGEQLHLGDRFVNHGVMPAIEWRRLLRESAFVIGIGDPVSGPTAIEALASGCSYLNPTFSPPRRINGIDGLEAASQHPFASTVPAPFVQPIAIADPETALQAVVTALKRAARRDWTAAELAPLVAALEPFTWRSYLARVAVEFDLPTSEGAAPTHTRATPRW